MYLTYIGKLEDGSVFDQSRKDPFSFTLGEGRVIKGWDIGVKSMQLGEKADLVIKSDYGYGDSGSPPKIPGGATLIFTVELVQIEERKAAKYLRSDEEIFQDSKSKKDQGTEKFKAGQFKEAYFAYREAFETLETLANETQEHTDFMKTLLLNISVCCNKFGAYNETLANASRALELDSKNAKGYYLRA